ncbi:MAG: sugar transferase, partial [Ilumatobacteraceae bacterium]
MSRLDDTYAGKRLVDLVIASAALAVAAPVIAATALLTRLTLGRPIMFRQRRLGLHGVEFDVLKLRTMSDERGPDGELLPDDARLGRVGRIIRASSLDELPQLWNVIRGEMSIVGPRPLPVQYRERYTFEQSKRMRVPPGITGLAQVRGRNTSDWDTRLATDVEYARRCSLALDLTIIARTVPTVLLRRGVSADGHATMPEFRPDRSRGGGGG